MFHRCLIANRGEIAMRLVRACEELGIEPVGVYSDADMHLPYLAHCAQTVRLGPAPAAKSYLRTDAILAAARLAACDCLHPGYGFLAENAGFARAVAEAGITWVGPNPSVIEAMGDKIDAKTLMQASGVPLVPGFVADPEAADAAVAEAERVGFPMLIKPSAGGGGKGMYVCRDADELRGNLEKATGDAVRSFGVGTLLVERYLATPRHIEVQVLGDRHGNVVHLHERECSIQRRHQKLVEESPSVALDDSTREAICQAGVRAAQACGYDSAGTVEFLYDDASGKFFFLEVNTRLQVEHPVTEERTGIDLAQAMFRVAAGERLWVRQADVKPRGHAIECRIVAEDPFSNFMPSFGRLDVLDLPQGPGVRVDTGFQAGNAVSVHYDSLVAKVIAYGQDRSQAIHRMQRALEDLHIVGPDTCIPFHRRLLRTDDFRTGDFNIHTAEVMIGAGLMEKTEAHYARMAALAVALEGLQERPPRGLGAGLSSDTDGSATASSHQRQRDAAAWRRSGRPLNPPSSGAW